MRKMFHNTLFDTYTRRKYLHTFLPCILDSVLYSLVVSIYSKTTATTDFFCNLTLLNLEPLVERREQLCTKFAKKTVKHPIHRNNKVVVPVARINFYRLDLSSSLKNIYKNVFGLAVAALEIVSLIFLEILSCS